MRKFWCMFAALAALCLITGSAQAQVDLQITGISDSPNDITLGTGNVQYFVNLYNASASPATNAQLSATLPASSTYVSATATGGATCNESGGVVTCTWATYSSGASFSATITVTPGTAGTNTLSATITANESDPVPANNSDSENTTVNDQIDLAVTGISDSPNDITLGTGNVQYFINMYNYSTSKATGTTLTVTLPASSTYVSATVSVGTCNESAGIVTCTIGDYPSGASYSSTITVTPGVAGTNTLSATINATQPDPDNTTAGHLDTDTETTTVNDQIDLAVTGISDSPNDITLGTGNVQYFINMYNYSTSKATGTTLTVTLPASSTYVSGTVSVGTCNESAGIVTCTIGDYPAGASYSSTITVTPGVAGTNTLSATIDATQPDPDNTTAGHLDTDTENTTVNDQIDLAVTGISDSPNDITLGTGNVQYFINMYNYSTSKATGTTLTVTLPASSTYVSGTVSVGSCSHSAGIVTCTIGDYPSGASYSSTITVTPGVAGTNTLSATIDATQPDPDNTTAGHLDTDSETTTVNDQIDLAVTGISDSPNDITLGTGNVQYFINMYNYSTSKATGTTLTVTLPASSTYVSGTVSVGTCSHSAGIVTCTIGDYPSGASYSSTITITPGAAGTNTLSATIDATQPDPDNTTAGHLDTDTETTTVNSQIDLAITGISDSPDPRTLGAGNVQYFINMYNYSTSKATGTTLTVTLPASSSYVSATVSVGTCNHSAGIVTCTIGDYPSGASYSSTITVTPGVAGTNTLSATIDGTQPDPDEATASHLSTDTETTQINPSSAPTISGFTPTSGPVNTPVTINGANFTGSTAVKFFNNVTASFTVVNDSTITTTLPSGATTGSISITNGIGTTSSAGTFTVTAGIAVTNTNDTGTGSLRDAITKANTGACPSPCNISFSIGSGLQTINVPSNLPTITAANVTIDATTQPGWSGTPIIELVEASAGPSASAQGLVLSGGGATIRGLVMRNWANGATVFPFGYAIYITSSNNTVAGCYLGTNAAGSAADGNRVGVVIEGAGVTGNTIGGLTAADRNVISGNTATNINIRLSASGNLVQGNYVGIDAAGTAALVNGGSGINLEDGGAGQTTSGNFIGGISAGAGNVISGNAWQGIAISGTGTDGNFVQGNHIGVDPAGNTAIANGWAGIGIFGGAQNNTIGGTSASARNVISGNTEDGVAIRDSGTSSNTIAGNYIGTNAAGTSAIANGWYGVDVFNTATNNTIGGGASSSNVISGNTLGGVLLTGAGTTGNSVLSNIIGLNASAVSAIANGGPGVLFNTSAANNTIGSIGSGNKIAFNNKGVVLTAAAGIGNTIRGNIIAQNTSIAIDLGNNGVTANDGSDGDTGPNNLQNFPVLAGASLSGSLLQFNATIDSSASGAFGLILDVYKADTSSPEQALTHLGSTACLGTTLSSSPVTMTVSGLSVGDKIVATATTYTTAGCSTADDGTSELSAAATVAVGPPHWASPVSGNWSVGSNWTTGAAPLAGEHAYIDATGSYTVTLDTTTSVLGVTISSGATLSIPSPRTLTLTTGASSVATGGTLNLNGGALAGAGTMTVNGTFSFSSGTLSLASTTLNNASSWTGGTLAGQLINANGQTMTMSGSTRTFDTGAQLTNNGTVNWSGGDNFANNGANAIINNTATGTWNIQSNGNFTTSCCTTPMMTINNAGTFSKTGGAGTSSLNSFVVYNQTGGSTNANSGTLTFGGTGSASSGNFNVTTGAFLTFNSNFTTSASAGIGGAGTVRVTAGTLTHAGSYTGIGTTEISGGTLSLAGASTTNAFLFSGGILAGAGGLTVNGPTTWSGGTLAGKLTNPAGQTMTMNGTTHVYDAGGQFDNLGTVNWSAGDNFGQNGANAVINNSGTWDIQANNNFTNSCCTVPMLTFNNTGSLTKSGGGATTSFGSHVGFNMTAGSVNANSGTLAFNATSATQSATGGAFNVGAGATLSFGANFTSSVAINANSGTVAVTAGTLTQSGAYTNVGATILSSGTLSLANPSSTNAFTFSGGTLAGSGGLTVNGPTTWSGGTLAGKLTNPAGQTMTMNGTTHVYDTGAQFDNAGTVNWSAGDNFGQNGANAVINNSGTWDIQANNNFTNSCCTVPMLTFNNTGSLTKSGGGGTTAFGSHVGFSMTAGSVNANSGTLAFNASSATQSASGGAINVGAGATLSFGASFTNGVAINANSGTVAVTAGTLTQNGAYTNVGATILSSGTLSLANPSTTNAFTFSGGTLAGSGGLTVNGPTTWSGGTLAGKLTNPSGQTMTMNGTTHVFDAGAQFDNAGTVNWSAGDNFGQNGANAVINNSGAWNVLADINFSNSCCTTPMLTFNNSGTFTKSGGSGNTSFGSFVTYNQTAGSTNVNNGTLILGGNGTASGGSLNIASTFTLSFGNSYTIAAGATVAGAGRFLVTGGSVAQGGTYTTVGETAITGGTLTFTAASASDRLSFSGGTLAGAGGLTVNGPGVWSGGTLAGKLTNAATQTMVLNGTTRTFDAGAQLDNNGTINWTAGTIFANNGANAFLNNNTGALFDIQGDLNFTQSCCTAPMLTFNNAGGTLRKSAGALAGTTFPSSYVLNNNGTLDLQRGFFNITGGYTQPPAGALNIDIDGLTAGTQFGVLSMTGNASLAGTLNVTLGFTPANGNTFQIVTYGSNTGPTDFGTKTGLSFPGGTLSYNLNATNITLATSFAAGTSIVKTAPATVAAGQSFNYTLTINNAGPEDAIDLSVSDTLAGVTWNSTTAPGWSCSAPPAIVCTMPVLAPGSSVITINVTAPLTPTSLNNTATVTATNDSTGGDNSSNVVTSVTAASSDLGLTKTADVSTVPVGGTITYTLVATNNGPSPATGVVVTDSLPAGQNVVSATSTQGTCTTSSPVTCTIGSLGAGNSATITIVVTATTGGTQNNTATIDGNEPDANAANDSASDSVAVTGASILVVTSAADSGNGTLRQAMLDANAGVCGPPCAIHFALSPVAPIVVATPLPAINAAQTTIDGTTQAGYSGTPLVHLDGASCIGCNDGITFSASSGVLKGLEISGFADAGAVVLAPAIAVRMLESSFHDNAGLGIDLDNDGATANDAGDSDTGGGNNRQNTPVINSAIVGGGTLYLDFSADSSSVLSTNSLRIDFFKADASGEGQQWLGYSCYAGRTLTNQTYSLAAGSVAAGNGVVATATSYSDGTCTTPNDGTSEFSGMATVSTCSAPNATISAPASTCASSTGNNASVPITPGATYFWSITNGTITGGAGTNAIVFTAGASGTTSLNVVVTHNGCNNGNIANVAINPPPAATVSGSNSICPGGSATITATLSGTAPFNIMWSDGVPQVISSGTIASRSVSPASTTTYTITSLSDASCSGTAAGSATITVNPVPSTTITGPNAVCAGGSVTLDAGAGFTTYLWSPGGETTRTITVTPGSTTNYSVVVTNASGCSSAPATHTVTVNPLPAVTITGPTATCNLAPVTLDAGAGFTSYAWSNGATTQQITVTPSVTTAYSVTVLDGNGCSASDSHTVNVTSNPTATITAPPAVCATSASNNASVAAQAGASYAWSITNGTITSGAGTNAIVFTAGASGNVTLGITVTAGSCTSNGSSTIPIAANPTVTITGPTTACPSQPFVLDAGAGFVSYQWNTGQTTPSVQFTQTAPSVTYSVIVTDANGCTATDTHTVTTSSAPNATITAPSNVDPNTTGHTASVPLQAGATYAWSISNGTITGGTGTNSITFGAGATGTVNLSVGVTVAGCFATSTVSIPINGTVVPTADFSVTKSAPSSVQTGASLTYTIVVFNAGPISANASLSDPLPAGVVFNSVSAGSWSCALNGAQVNCNGFLGAGASNTILVNATAPLQSGTITNTVTVSSADDDNVSNNSASATTTVTARPGVCATTPPSLLSPANNATITSPATFSWTAVDGVMFYELWLVNGGTTVLGGSTSNTTLTLHVASGVTQWFVVARLAAGCDALVSAQRTFTVQQADNCATHGAPQITSPTEGSIVNANQTIAWMPVPQAIGYRVWIEVNGGAPQDAGTTDGAIVLSVQLPPGAITLYVDALFGGCPPARSAAVHFTVPAPDPCANRGAATLVSPANNAVLQTSSVTLQWTGAANASAHRVWASIDGATPEVLGTTTNDSLHVHIPDGDVVWWVQELFDGCAATESARFRFVIPPKTNCSTARPEIVSPANGATVTNGEVTFDWNGVDGATGYDVYLAVANGTAALIGSTSASVTSLTHFVPAGELEWTVVARVDRCPDRESQKARFTYDPPAACENNQRAILVSPLDGEVTTAPASFQWNPPAGATRSELYAIRGTNAPVLIASTTGDSAPASNLATGKLRWFVRTFFAQGCSPLDSDTFELEIAATPPPCSTLTPPVISAPGEISSGVEFLIQWSSTLGATGYQLQLASQPGFEGASLVNTSATSHPLTRTNGGNTPLAVYARVRAIDSRCTPLPAVSPYGPASAIFILPAQGTAGNVPLGDNGIVSYTIPLGAELAGQPFTAVPTEPWLSVTPSSGIVAAGGTTLHVSATTTTLGVGANTGSVVVTVGSSSGRIIGNPTTVVTTPISVNLVTPVTPAPKNTPPPDALIIPAVANADGINSHFQSDVRVSNTSPQLIKYQLTYIPTGDAGITAGRQTTFSVEPGRTVALDDILKTWFGTGTSNSQGSLEIRPLTQTATSTSSAAIGALANLVSFASSRTFNKTPNGTFGQYIPAVPFANFLGKAADAAQKSVLSLQQIAQSDKYRTNLGLLEGSGESASVLVKVFGSNGQPITSFPVNLNGGQQTQLNAFLWQKGITLEDGRVEVEVVSGNGKVTAYASVLDNETSDAVLVTPVSLSDKGNTKWVVPGVADLRSGFADWQTDMRVFNADTNAAEITATFYSQNTATPPVSKTFTLAAGEVKQLDKLLPSLFGVSNDGGALHLSTASAARLIATARTYNQTSTGTYGQFISAVTPLEAVGVGSRPLQLLQVEESTRFRSNIGFAEVTGKPVRLEVTVTPPDAKFSASTTIDLKANEYRQIGSMLKGILGPNDVYNARISVRAIAGEGRATAYASVIDLKTNDPTYNPAQ